MHPKLATVFNRSLLAASTAALIAGPLAVTGAAQTLDAVSGTAQAVGELTCDEAVETDDLTIIAEFCDAEELPAPLAKATEAARRRLQREADKASETVEKNTGVKVPNAPIPTNDDDGGTGGDEGGAANPDSSPTTGVLPSSPSGSDEKPASTSPSGSRQVRNQGEQPRGISAGGPGGNGNSGAYSDGPVYSGMRSKSSLTLQPFAAPLVSVPPVYVLPQVAQQLFGLDGAATTGDPAVAADGTAATAYSSTGFTATPADPTGWLAATATGLIMLLGAAHALNGARTPKRRRA